MSRLRSLFGFIVSKLGILQVIFVLNTLKANFCPNFFYLTAFSEEKVLHST